MCLYIAKSNIAKVGRFCIKSFFSKKVKCCISLYYVLCWGRKHFKGYISDARNNSKLPKLRDMGVRMASPQRGCKNYLFLNIIKVDNNSKQTQHLISLKTQKTDPNECFIEQFSLVLKKIIQIQGYSIYRLCLEIS